jgi:hypothetical protein
MTMRHGLKTSISALAAAAMLAASPAQAATAGIPDSDTALLTAMVLQQLKDSAQLGGILLTAQQSLQTAQQSVAVLQSLSDVATEAKFLIENPDEILNGAKAGFESTFPELKAIQKDAERLSESFSGQTTGGVNPFALQELFRNGNLVGDKGYNTLMMLDETIYKLTDEHLLLKREMQDIKETNEEKRKLLGRGILTESLAATTAKAALDTAVTSAVTSSNIAELVRMQKLERMKAADAGSASSVRMEGAYRNLSDVGAVDTRLNPLAPTKVGGDQGGPRGLQ